ncbi:MAG: hypothetical protein H7256_03590 [Bdellovibrio sp.]|nr:hypothetical protein [Bdellovibrio sp.]
MAIVESVEKQVGQFLTTAKEVQTQLQRFQKRGLKQGLLITQQGEIKAREFLLQVFESGLTLLGQGMLTARKATESFVAETHRKLEKIEKLNASVEAADSEELEASADEESQVTPLESLNGKHKAKNPKFKAAKNKKQHSHLANTSRQH